VNVDVNVDVTVDVNVDVNVNGMITSTIIMLVRSVAGVQHLYLAVFVYSVACLSLRDSHLDAPCVAP
jgi:hypothetical protein